MPISFGVETGLSLEKFFLRLKGQRGRLRCLNDDECKNHNELRKKGLFSIIPIIHEYHVDRFSK
ncbi:CFC_HP_G0103060.mRNA.1.CDS.1 [Saccharomyces cerevisiae]|nr:CFC_HP_G0103060.mRNA.1.CDS.1 [Saccharomyces cerevisiae]CAI6907723.1 CFC_HP_G0103060.mRNA.1.CDS.1 [Saccharomyces cerevisiae]